MAHAELLWIDCEFTSLNDNEPQRDRIWEIAALATDRDLNYLGSCEALVAQSPDVIKAVADRPWWRDHPEDFARMQEAAAHGQSPSQVDMQLVAFADEHFGDRRVLIAGNSIGNDKRRIEFTFPTFHARLGHQVLDVTSIRKWGQFQTGEKFHRNEADRHRAMGDILLSIEELVFWDEKLRSRQRRGISDT